MVRQLRRLFFIAVFVTSACFIIKTTIRSSPSKELEFASHDSHVNAVGDGNGLCYYDASCASPRILFQVQTETEHAPPYACLNDIRLFDVSSIKRGMNVAAMNVSSGVIFDHVSFDVAVSDEKMMKWFMGLPDKTVVVAVSFGDIAEHVSWHSRHTFSTFGATKIADWRDGSAYALVGQRGISAGAAYETVSPLLNSPKSAIKGCFDLPLGGSANVSSAGVFEVHRANEERLKELGAIEDSVNTKFTIGNSWKNCGMEKACPQDSISAYFFSGEHKDDHPKMCISEKVLFDRGLNKAGRGLNLAIIDPKTSRVTSVANFDTYADESQALEQWLDAIPTGFIVAVVSFDEASNMLSEMAKRIFYEMGSSMVDRLKFRASWFFIGYKGIGAYSPFEDLNVPPGNNWAKPIKKSFCLPKSQATWSGKSQAENTVSSLPTRVRNLPKRHFCAKYDRHEGFCDEEKLDDVIIPKGLSDVKKVSTPEHAVFNVPILVVAGLSSDSLRVTLESLLDQEGINTQMVLVAIDKEYPENSELASLFHVKSVAVSNNKTYNEMLLLSLSIAFSVFPKASTVAVVEEDVVLSPDWLSFLSNVLSPLVADSNLDIALAFNPNGYNDTSGLPDTVYRWPYQQPMYSYLLKREFFEKKIEKDPYCCLERRNWQLESSRALVPAVSRVRINLDALNNDSSLFSRPRISSVNASSIAQDFVSKESYDRLEERMIKEANSVVLLEKIPCSSWEERLDGNSLTRRFVVVAHGDENLLRAAKCFGLSLNERFAMHYDSIRFGLRRDVDVLVVSSDRVDERPLLA